MQLFTFQRQNRAYQLSLLSIRSSVECRRRRSGRQGGTLEGEKRRRSHTHTRRTQNADTGYESLQPRQRHGLNDQISSVGRRGKQRNEINECLFGDWSVHLARHCCFHLFRVDKAAIVQCTAVGIIVLINNFITCASARR